MKVTEISTNYDKEYKISYPDPEILFVCLSDRESKR